MVQRPLVCGALETLSRASFETSEFNSLLFQFVGCRGVDLLRFYGSALTLRLGLSGGGPRARRSLGLGS